MCSFSPEEVNKVEHTTLLDMSSAEQEAINALASYCVDAYFNGEFDEEG